MAVAQSQAGLRLDATYTAKTFAAVCDFIGQKQHAGDTVLYWHTYHRTDERALAEPVDYRTLPRALHWVFEGSQSG
jgi:hypothetical protein